MLTGREGLKAEAVRRRGWRGDRAVSKRMRGREQRLAGP
jgi:hypothetical protein